MFCPNCKTEYRAGFTQCSDCGATLVSALESSSDPADQVLALAWRGTDPTGFSAAKATLNGAGIQSYTLDDHDQLVWGLAIARPRYSLLVRKSDLPASLELLESIQERSPLANVKDIWKSDPNLESDENFPDALAASEDDTTQAPDDISEPINPNQATALAWDGDSSMLDVLDACLRENGIASVRRQEGKSAKILVTPQREARAKEIIREVIEATPPE